MRGGRGHPLASAHGEVAPAVRRQPLPRPRLGLGLGLGPRPSSAPRQRPPARRLSWLADAAHSGAGRSRLLPWPAPTGVAGLAGQYQARCAQARCAQARRGRARARCERVHEPGAALVAATDGSRVQMAEAAVCLRGRAAGPAAARHGGPAQSPLGCRRWPRAQARPAPLQPPLKLPLGLVPTLARRPAPVRVAGAQPGLIAVRRVLQCPAREPPRRAGRRGLRLATRPPIATAARLGRLLAWHGAVVGRKPTQR